jgi:hypothetical protein
MVPGMKTLFPILLTVLLSLSAAYSRQAIYKDVSTSTLIGNGNTLRVSSKGFFVLDLDGTNLTVTTITAFTLNGQKYFTVKPFQNYRAAQVFGPNGAAYYVIAKAESPGTSSASTLLESVYYQGKVSVATLDSSGPSYLPKTATSVAQNITYNAANGVTLAGTGSGTLTLDIKGSLASNNAGESFDSAVNRLAATFAQAGYTQVSP